MADLAVLKRDIADVVTQKVRKFQESGELHLPANYSAENALKSAWLILQGTVDKDKKPALEVCTKDSVANSLLRMVTLGLNPEKKQCYFIVYGNKLSCDVSYFGDMHIAKEVDESIVDIYAEVVYEGDNFKYQIKKGKKVITEHEQCLENIDKKKIKAAYAIVEYDNGKEETTIMTFDEIKQAWKQSKMYPIDDKGNLKVGTTHDKFTADMAKKTVIRKACKPIINSSDDRNLMMKRAYEETSEAATEAQVEAEIADNANSEYIDVTPEKITDNEEAKDISHMEEKSDPEQAACGF